MTTVTVEALASFGSGPIPAESSTSLLLLCGSASPALLERHRFEFLDGQELRPGARGAVRMTFAADRLPPLSGPLLVWAGRVIGHIWGLHAVHRAQPDGHRAQPDGLRAQPDGPRAQPDGPRSWTRTDAPTGLRVRAASLAATVDPSPSVMYPVSEPAM